MRPYCQPASWPANSTQVSLRESHKRYSSSSSMTKPAIRSLQRLPITPFRAPPSFHRSKREIPSRQRRRNPLGAKGIGESGTIGSTPAVQNAVIDALESFGRLAHRHAVYPRASTAGHPKRRSRNAAPARANLLRYRYRRAPRPTSRRGCRRVRPQPTARDCGSRGIRP